MAYWDCIGTGKSNRSKAQQRTDESDRHPDRSHNPLEEVCWVSCLRENLTSSSYGEGLETGPTTPRQSFTRQTGYRNFKELLGFDQYQLLSFTGIQRFWAIQFLTQNFLECQRQEWMKNTTDVTLGDVVRRIREEFLGQIIVFVYQQALERKPLFDILKQLKLSA
jgi:hypothetical protein